VGGGAGAGDVYKNLSSNCGFRGSPGTENRAYSGEQFVARFGWHLLMLLTFGEFRENEPREGRTILMVVNEIIFPSAIIIRHF
jgi:hypothetical protein